MGGLGGALLCGRCAVGIGRIGKGGGRVVEGDGVWRCRRMARLVSLSLS